MKIVSLKKKQLFSQYKGVIHRQLLTKIYFKRRMFFLLWSFLLRSFTDNLAAIVFGCSSLSLSNFLDFLFFFFGCIESAASDTAPRAGTGAVWLCKKFGKCCANS